MNPTFTIIASLYFSKIEMEIDDNYIELQYGKWPIKYSRFTIKRPVSGEIFLTSALVRIWKSNKRRMKNFCDQFWKKL